MFGFGVEGLVDLCSRGDRVVNGRYLICRVLGFVWVEEGCGGVSEWYIEMERDMSARGGVTIV